MTSLRSRVAIVCAVAFVVAPSVTTPATGEVSICPQPTTPPATADWMPNEAEWATATERANSMTVEELAGASLVVSYRGRDNKRSNAQSDHNLRTLGKKQPSRALPALGASGVILFPDNAKTAKQAYYEGKAFARVMSSAFFTAVDQEGGSVHRLRGDIEPPVAAKKIGTIGKADVAAENAFHSAQQLRAAGIDVVFAPVADVRSRKTPKSLRPRTLGYNATTVGKLIAAQVVAYNSQGVMAVTKHFPGIGAIPADTHKFVSKFPYSVDRLCAQDLAPFRAAITAGVTAIMVGHGVYPALDANPASGSRVIVTDLLRNEMNFGGIIITDSMTMKAASANIGDGQDLAVRAIAAGVDLVLMSGNPVATKNQLVAALNAGTISIDDRRASIARVLAYRAAQARVAASLKKFKPGSGRLLQAAQWFAYELRALA